jgi:hypothetical protein
LNATLLFEVFLILTSREAALFVRTVHSSRDGSCPDVLREQGGAARRGGKKRTLEFKRVRLNGYF